VISMHLFQGDPNTVEFAAGDIIFKTGATGSEMYVVRSGEIDIIVGSTVVETVGEGGIFGEMALIDEETRSADAIARSACTLVRVNKRRFEFLVQQTPFFALQVMKLLVARIRNADRLISGRVIN
jgi:CRP/FNR family cyclic AMP-dependent transcriptional regulator